MAIHKKCQQPVETPAGKMQERLQNRGFDLFAQIVSTKKTMFFQIITDSCGKIFASLYFHQKKQVFFNRCISNRSTFLMKSHFHPRCEGYFTVNGFLPDPACCSNQKPVFTSAEIIESHAARKAVLYDSREMQRFTIGLMR